MRMTRQSLAAQPYFIKHGRTPFSALYSVQQSLGCENAALKSSVKASGFATYHILQGFVYLISTEVVQRNMIFLAKC